ncbi:MAG: PilZ domain-containing protein [Terracidiphilus sp.]
MKDGEVNHGWKTVEGKSAAGREGGLRTKVSRAQRYEIDTLVRYRIRGEKEWREGAMKNISISGVLLHAASSLPTDTVIELRFSLPVHLNGENAAEVLCRGSVVRSSKSGGPGAAATVAARIKHSRFLRQKDRKDEAPRYFSGEAFLVIS